MWVNRSPLERGGNLLELTGVEPWQIRLLGIERYIREAIPEARNPDKSGTLGALKFGGEIRLANFTRDWQS
jgi:hypothetical protein